jgi:hypothetical protein
MSAAYLQRLDFLGGDAIAFDRRAIVVFQFREFGANRVAVGGEGFDLRAGRERGRDAKREDEKETHREMCVRERESERVKE